MKEFEKKLMLTEDEYLFLLYRNSTRIPLSIQTNYYFDTDDLVMNAKGVTCRVRFKDGKYTTTMKNHNIQKGDCSIEHNMHIKDEFDINAFWYLGLKLQGTLTTERLLLSRSKNCEMVLDKNIYLGISDYELEVEYLEGYEKEANRMIDNIKNVLYSNQHILSREEFFSRPCCNKSKSQRFFEKLKQ